MRDRPNLPDHVIVEALASGWGIEMRSLEYAPVGAGSYHWLAQDAHRQRWFVTVDDLSWSGVSDAITSNAIFEDLRAAMRTAVALRGSGLTFVVAPVACASGEVLGRPGPEWSIAVFPAVDGRSGTSGRWQDAELRAEAARLIGRLHNAAPPPAVQRWSFELPGRSWLMDAVAALGSSWDAGPLGEEARGLLSASVSPLGAALKRYDRLAEAVSNLDEPWVVTHGEPHRGNFIETAAGLQLIDWDTVRLAPRERDLAVVVAGDVQALAAYQAESGQVPVRSEAMLLFHLRWQLTDIAIFVRRLRLPHTGSSDDQMALRSLAASLQPEQLQTGRVF